MHFSMTISANFEYLYHTKDTLNLGEQAGNVSLLWHTSLGLVLLVLGNFLRFLDKNAILKLEI